MGNTSQGANNDSEQNQTDEQREEWEKWVNNEREQQQAEMQREKANRETELQRIEEARRSELKHRRASEEMKKKEIEIKELRDEVKNLKPGDSIEFPEESITFPRKLNVGLFGTTGIGKSSLLNSLKYAFKGELTELTREQTSTANFQGGNTVRRLEVGITKYLTFIDNRGVGAEDLETINAANEIIRQLEGRASFAEKVDWRKESISKKTPVNENKRIHCTVLVFDAQNPQSVYTVINKLVKEVFEWQGRYPICVITHVDLATPDQLENMYVVLNSAGLVDTYEVANITSNNDSHDERKELSLDHQLNLLRLMKRCIKEGDCIFSLREEIERQEVQQAKEKEREDEKAKQNQARLEREREKATKAKEAEEARIEKEKEEAVEKAKLELIETYAKDRKAEEARIKKEKEKEEARIENEKEKEEARIEKEKAIEKVKLELRQKLEKEKQKLYYLAAIMFLVIVWLALK